MCRARRLARRLGAGPILDHHGRMLHRLCVKAAACLIAASGSLCLLATSSVVAKHKPSVAAKHKASKHKSTVARHPSSKRRSSAAKDKSPAAAQRKSVDLTPRTPVDKYDCIAESQTFYQRARTVFIRGKQSIPQEFERVASNLDEFCGEEEFEKARISIDWMSACLQNYTKDDKQGFCSRDKSYFCALDPQSDGCRSP